MKTCGSCKHFDRFDGHRGLCDNPDVERKFTEDSNVMEGCHEYRPLDVLVPVRDSVQAGWAFVLRIERTDLGGALSEPSYFVEASIPIGTDTINSGSEVSHCPKKAAQMAIKTLIAKLDKTPYAL